MRVYFLSGLVSIYYIQVILFAWFYVVFTFYKKMSSFDDFDDIDDTKSSTDIELQGKNNW